MVRQIVPKTTLPGPYPAASVAVTYTAADATNFEHFQWTGNEILLIRNTGAGARTWTLTSVADPYGRTLDITTESIAAGAERAIGRLGDLGWRQTDGMVRFQASHAEVTYAILQLP